MTAISRFSFIAADGGVGPVDPIQPPDGEQRDAGTPAADTLARRRYLHRAGADG